MADISIPNSVASKLPAWLHDVFILDVLSKRYTNPQIIDFDFIPLSNKYSIFRGYVIFIANEFEGNSNLKFIVKYQPNPGQSKKKSNEFNREMNIYSDVIPIFEQTLKAVGDCTEFSPRCYFQQCYPRKVIVLEDLQSKGYEVIQNRLLHIDEVTAALKKIGKWHAVGYKLAKEDPNFFKKYGYGVLFAPRTFETTIMKSGFENFIALLKRTPALKLFLPFFEGMRLNYGDELAKCFVEYELNRQPDVYYTLNHGDFHSRNMMFKRNKITNEVEDVKFIDFQISYMGPMATDLMYSLYQLLTSVERYKRRDQWIHVHFAEFQETVKKLAFDEPKPKVAEFRDQIMRNKFFEYYLVFTLLPIWYAHDKGENTRQLLTSEEGRRKLYNNPNYISELHNLLPLYMILGYFDLIQ